MRLILALAGLLLSVGSGQSRESTPFVPVGVVYDGGRMAEQDLVTIRSLGFNSIRRRDARAQVEDSLSGLARQLGLRVFVPSDVSPAAAGVEVAAGSIAGSSRPATSADVRLRAWDALARGARAVFFHPWSAANGTGLVEEDGRVTPRAQAAGEFAGIVSRNAALFTALRPRDRERPHVRVDGNPSGIETRFLESAAATVIVAINHADIAQKVTLRFPPDTPEAIWQNLETGAAVSFVMGTEGPFLTHAFLARDVVVLVRARRLF